VLPAKDAAAWVLHTAWSAVTVLAVTCGRTVILKIELSEQDPEVTVLLNHVVAVRLAGWYEGSVVETGAKVTLSVDDAHAYAKVPSPPAGVPESRAGAVPVHIVSCPCAGRFILNPVIPGSTVMWTLLLVLVHADEVTTRLYQMPEVSGVPGRSSATEPDILLKVVPLALLIHW